MTAIAEIPVFQARPEINYRSEPATLTAWGVKRQEKVSGQWKKGNIATLQEHLTNAVCLAAAQYLVTSAENTCPEQRGAAEHASPGTSGTGAAKHVPPDVILASKRSADLENVAANF